MEYITSKELAKALGLSHCHTRLLLRQGKIKGVRIGRDWLIKADSVNYSRRRRPKKGVTLDEAM